MRLLRSIALISCFVPAVFAQSSDDWRFAHPGATLVGGFNVKATLDSPLVNSLIKEATARDPSTGMMVGMVRSAMGGISDVRFSVRDMGKGKDPDVLALVTGVLDDALVGSMTKGKTEVRRIDANTVLIGEGQSLEDAVTRLSKPALGIKGRALDRSAALATNDLWVAGTLPEIPNMSIPMLDSLRGLALGISMQSDLKIEVALEMNNAKTAEDLVSAARRSQVQQPAMGAALKSEVDGSTARFSFAMPGDQVIQAVHEGIKNGSPQSSFAGLFGQSLPTFSSTTPTPAPRPEPMHGTVRIYGLDEGTREVQVEPRH